MQLTAPVFERTALVFALAVALWPTHAPAGGWEPLDGAGIAKALTARVLTYPETSATGAAMQDFFADGRTLYNDQWGHWDVRGDRYCSNWPPSDRWSCYDIARQGLDIRFTSDRGEVTIGRYGDLD